jgi:phosphatidate cytidylyltransferase
VDPRRVYAALVFVPCFYVLVQYLPPIAFFVFVATGILLAQYEYYRLHFSEKWRASVALGLGLGLLVATAYARPTLLSPGLTITLVVASVLLYQVFSRRELKGRLQDSAVLAFGVFYIAWLLGPMIPIRGLNEGPYLIFFLFLATWANDTAAYYTGTLFGTHPLAPVLSPRKTWEGVVGGLLGSLAAAFICRAWFLPSLGAPEALGLGLMFGVLAPLGDLCESILKRSAGVKESGGLIPGHGGMLDRVDSLIFTTPAFYYYLLAIRTP